MDAEDVGRLIGQLLVPFVFLILAAWVAQRAKRSEPRSRRLAGYGLACGLLTLPALGVLAVAGSLGGRPVIFAVGGAMLLAGAAAVTLGAMAASVRKADGGTGGSVGAFVAGGIALFLGTGTVLLPLVNRGAGGADETAFAHRVEAHGFEITIPSSSWKPFAGPKKIADFANRMPQMVAGVMLVEPDATGSRFESEVARAKQVAQRNATGQKVLLDERGTNDHGQPVWVLLLDENGSGQRIYTGMSVTWLNKSKVVVLFFEGQHRNRSQSGQQIERSVFEKAAPRFLRSVR